MLNSLVNSRSIIIIFHYWCLILLCLLIFVASILLGMLTCYVVFILFNRYSESLFEVQVRFYGYGNRTKNCRASLSVVQLERNSIWAYLVVTTNTIYSVPTELTKSSVSPDGGNRHYRQSILCESKPESPLHLTCPGDYFLTSRR